MNAAPPVLALRGLTVSFGATVALDDVTVDVPAGASVAVLGANGAGKSTLMAAAVGLVSARRGSVETLAERVAFVPQRLDVHPSFPISVVDVVRMGRFSELGMVGRFGRRDDELVERALADLGIAELAPRRFGTLSGGERQRTLLAQAAAQDADLLLLDEPFTGVDAPTRRALRELIGRWRSDGRTVMVATHDLESAARDYDLVICLNRRLVAFGPAAETCTEEILAETFAGHVVRVGDLVVDTAHHHAGAS